MSQYIKHAFKLVFHFETQDPFLFLAHHRDLYPKGNDKMGPAVSLEGRDIGNDFDLNNDFKMYHGRDVAGFPEHPHRGFETVTIVLEGFVDHFDSFGASGRYGEGDIQWMTAGRGMQHCEMFPCVYKDKPNPLELFQVWLNLPKKSKFVLPYYEMMWSEDYLFEEIPSLEDGFFKMKLISGELYGKKNVCPAPDSLASDDAYHVAIAIFEVPEGGSLYLEKLSEGVERTLYYYEGDTITLAGESFDSGMGLMLTQDEIVIKNGNKPSKFLLLQGRPIGEPVVSYGPFVMNTKREIEEAYRDYQTTQFGGWPWKRPDPVYNREEGRIAQYPDGKLIKPNKGQ